jgi:hypothetical protein
MITRYIFFLGVHAVERSGRASHVPAATASLPAPKWQVNLPRVTLGGRLYLLHHLRRRGSFARLAGKPPPPSARSRHRTSKPFFILWRNWSARVNFPCEKCCPSAPNEPWIHEKLQIFGLGTHRQQDQATHLLPWREASAIQRPHPTWTAS